MVLPDKGSDWRPIQELVLAKIQSIFRIHDEEEEQKALPKRSFEQVKAIFNQSISVIL
jgi:hypothetical protein